MAKQGLVWCRRDCHPWPFQPGHQGSPWWGECGSSPLLHERGPPPALGASLSLDRLPGDSTWRRAVTEEGRQRAWGGRARSGQRAQCWGLACNPALLLNSCVTSVSQQTSLSLRWLSVGWITTPLCRLRSRDGLHVPCPEQGERGYSAARQGDPGIGGHVAFLTHLGSACDHSTLLCSTAVGGGPHSCLPELLGAGVHRAFLPAPTGVWVPWAGRTLRLEGCAQGPTAPLCRARTGTGSCSGPQMLSCTCRLRVCAHAGSPHPPLPGPCLMSNPVRQGGSTWSSLSPAILPFSCTTPQTGNPT